MSSITAGEFVRLRHGITEPLIWNDKREVVGYFTHEELGLVLGRSTRPGRSTDDLLVIVSDRIGYLSTSFLSVC
jgi:hypothetical protein